MSHINIHPAPGFGDLLPGFFVVPQNPILDAGTPLVPSVQATAGGRAARVPHMGDLLPSSFVVPQNPILDALAGPGMHGLGATPVRSSQGTIMHPVVGNPIRALQLARIARGGGHLAGCGGMGCCGGLSCGGEGQNYYGLSGLGQTYGLTDEGIINGIPNWVLYGLGAYMLYATFTTGKRHYQTAKRKVSAAGAGLAS